MSDIAESVLISPDYDLVPAGSHSPDSPADSPPDSPLDSPPDEPTIPTFPIVHHGHMRGKKTLSTTNTGTG